MDLAQFWILLALTVICNLIWPPVTLLITLAWGVLSTKKTLAYAQSIEKKVTDAISTLEEEAKTEDLLAEILTKQSEELKTLLSAYRANTLQAVQKEIDTAKQDVIKQQQAAGKGPGIQEMIMAGLSAMQS